MGDVPGRRKSKCKGPEVRGRVAGLKNRKRQWLCFREQAAKRGGRGVGEMGLVT